MKLDKKVTILGITTIMIVGLCWLPYIFSMKNAEDQVSAPFISLYYAYKGEIKHPVQEAFYVETKIDDYNAYQITQCLYGEKIEVTTLSQNQTALIAGSHDSAGIISLRTKNKNVCPLKAYSLNKLSTKIPALVCAATAQTFYNKNEPAKIIPMGCELHVEESLDEDYFQFVDPRGFSLLIAKKDVVLIEELNQLNQKNFRPRIIDQACKLIDYPYQWGGQCGCEGSGFDCAGLVHTVYRSCGINIKRGVRDQFDHSNQLASPSHVQPGDFIFFYQKNGKINIIIHVILYLGNDEIIEASPVTGKVTKSTFESQFGKKIIDCINDESFIFDDDRYFISFRSLLN